MLKIFKKSFWKKDKIPSESVFYKTGIDSKLKFHSTPSDKSKIDIIVDTNPAFYKSVQPKLDEVKSKIAPVDFNEIEFEEQEELAIIPVNKKVEISEFKDHDDNYLLAETVEDVEEEVLRLEQKEIEMIKKSLEKNKGKRKAAADELGISERTLYRKIKQFDL